MSFVDLATLTLHRRNELEARINVFTSKCDHAINDIRKLQMQAQGFPQHLNCEPSQLKERFLNCMRNLDEYIYIITDFNLALGKLEETTNVDFTPVHDTSMKPLTPVTTFTAYNNLIDALSEPTPSTSTACSNLCPSEKPKRIKVPKEDQLLIAFSSASCSEESVPQTKIEEKKQTRTVAEDVKKVTVKAEPPSPLPPPQPQQTKELCNLPAQKMLQTDQMYSATIMNIDGASFWVITDNTEQLYRLIEDMTSHYSEAHVEMSLEEITSLTYCACYDDDGSCYYRGLFIRLHGEADCLAEVFLVDTGEVRTMDIDGIQPLAPQFCAAPPFARCCHLAGIDLLSYHNKDLMQKQEEFMNTYIGRTCTIEVDDNTSESLGVYVFISEDVTLNNILVEEGLALAIDKPTQLAAPEPAPVQGPPELLDEIDVNDCPEYEDPVEAVTGYSNRDEADICKHYKGGPEKTCFKGSRCTKRHVMKHPDGWTLDRVEVVAKVKYLPLPAPDTWHKVRVTCVCHFDRLYVQIINDNEKDEVSRFGVVLPPATLPALIRDMNSPATRAAYKPLTMTPAPSELVAALYPFDNQWYRARVLTSSRADQNVEVMYVDYGNVVWVKEDEIRILESRFTVLAAQAVRCAVAGVAARAHCSKQWARAKAQLADLVQDQVVDAHVIARDYDEVTVELFDGEGYSIAEQLAALGAVELKDYSIIDETNVEHKVVVP